MDNRNLTIKDIAKMANVSPGTVDRVIHNRGRVSEKVLAKVNVILEEIQYKPNVFAQSLKKKKSLQIAALIPYHREDGYWNNAHEGIRQATEDYEHFGVNLQLYEFNSKDPNDYLNKANQVLEDPPDSLLVSPVFLNESLEFLRKCESLSLPYITFNTFIPDLNSRSYIGQDLFQSGRLAASLIDQCRTKIENALIIHLDENPQNAPHMMEKQRGFEAYFEERNPQVKIKSITILHSDMENINDALNKKAYDLRNVAGVYVTTARAHLIAYSVKGRFQNSLVIGYDLIRENIDGLKSGTIDFLINQNPYQSAYDGISKLVDIMVFDKSVEKRKLLPLDIVTRENFQSYLNQ